MVLKPKVLSCFSSHFRFVTLKVLPGRISVNATRQHHHKTANGSIREDASKGLGSKSLPLDGTRKNCDTEDAKTVVDDG